MEVQVNREDGIAASGYAVTPRIDRRRTAIQIDGDMIASRPWRTGFRSLSTFAGQDNTYRFEQDDQIQEEGMVLDVV